MIQDIAPHHLWNQYDPKKMCRPQDFVVSVKNGAMLVAEGTQALRFPRLDEVELPPETSLVYLFSIDDAAFFLARGEIFSTEEWCYVPLRILQDDVRGPREMFYAAFTAMHLATWYGNNRFCGRCGHETTDSEAERALVCPACHRIIYPQLIPAIIAGVTDGDRILLTKYAHRKMSFYALIAGFTEIGETLEECVAREVLEEVGLRVKNIRYYKSQPWGTVQDILAGFYCDVDGDPTIHMEKNELKEALWVRREDVTPQLNDFSLTNEMMMQFRAGKEPR